MAQRITTEELQASLEAIMDRVASNSERLVIERDGKPIAALVSIHYYEALERTRERSRERMWQLIERTREANEDVDPTEIEKAVDLAVKEVRAERRARQHTSP